MLILDDLEVPRAKNSRRVRLGFPKPGTARILRLQHLEGLVAGSRDDVTALVHRCQLQLDPIIVG